jgi:membrane carboxypeptidase/penicillin-binding protein
MNAILVKIFATALALSQVTTQPGTVNTQFDAARDQEQVVQILRAGCAHIRKAFDIEDVNVDELIATAMDDPQALGGSIKALHGLKFEDLFTAYRQFCKNETVEHSPVDIAEVIAFYNKAAADLPDEAKIKELKPRGLSVVLDRTDSRFADVAAPDQRRIPVPLREIPELVQKAFVSAEDKRFFQHKGIDERGMVRAFIGNLAEPGRPQGGSTITQQVAKNLLVGDDVTYERKIREILVASRLERVLGKSDILALYLNSIYLGRGAWGVELAARSYFGKAAAELTLGEGALLAALTKGPNYFSPERHPDRARERAAYVLNRMQEDGVIDAEQVRQATASRPQLVAYERLRRDSGFHFLDHLGREAKAATGIDILAGSSYTIHATIDPGLQRATEAALQEGLAAYELRTGRARFNAPEANLADAIKRIETERNSNDADRRDAPQPLEPPTPTWQLALQTARLPLYDVHWPAAVVVALPGGKNAGIRVGLTDGRMLPLASPSAAARRALKLYDVIYVQIAEAKGKSPERAELRVPPTVQGAALVLENKTGRILAMAGGFSYPLSQLNRTTQMRRQPGSALKPITYLAALDAGLQPNTLVLDEPITFAPIGNTAFARERDYWSPRNYDRGSSGVVTLRRALENSKNRVTARLLDGGIKSSPEESLDRVCEIAMEAQLYGECVRYYPFVLGAQPVRMIELAAFYAAIANEGARPSPHAIDSIEQNGLVIYRHDAKPAWVGSADPGTFYQLKTMLQGVVERGTARPIRQLAPYVGGKTGTSENENDAWFVGFSNDVTIAVWVGYDNAGDKRRTLGSGETGGRVAVPIFEAVMQAAWSQYAPRTVLSPPSAQAQRQLVDLPVDLSTGNRLAYASPRAFVEHFHLDGHGQLEDTQYRLVSRGGIYAYRDSDMFGEAERYPGWTYPPGSPYDNGAFPPSQWRVPPRTRLSPWGGVFGDPYWWNDARPRPRRIDPDYFWGRRGF